MLHGKTIAVAMPAYYAERTVEKTVRDLPRDVVDHVILVDDASKDRTFEIAQSLGIRACRNEKNLNYGGNVKRCLQLAVDAGADVTVLLHPDGQYPPKLVGAMASMLAAELYDLCLASRTTGPGARSSGMPFWRRLPNWGLTRVMNLCLGTHHTDYHTGCRAYSRRLLQAVPFHRCRDDFIFDNQLFVGALRLGFRTCEITCPTSYGRDTRSIEFGKAVRYGFQCLRLSAGHLGWRIAGKP